MKAFPVEYKISDIPLRKYKNVIDTPSYKKFCLGDMNDYWSKFPVVSNQFKDLFQRMFLSIRDARASLQEISAHPWMTGDLPTPQEISNEIERIRQYKLAQGKLFDETQLRSTADLYVRPSEVMKSGSMDDTIDVQDEFEALEKEDRTAQAYLDGLFEWTFFKAVKEASYLLVLIVGVIQNLEIERYLELDAKVTEDSKHFVAEFGYKLGKEDEEGSSLIKGTVTIYKDDAEKAPKDLHWVVFKRTEGDPFLFRTLFEQVAMHPQIQQFIKKTYE